MSRISGPTVTQRRLALELRRLREHSRLTGDEVATRLSWSTAKVSRLENARTGARVSDVADLLKLYGVQGQRFQELVTLATEATRRGWWEDYPALTPGYAELISLESEADAALLWDTMLVPGLLQAEGYARHIVGAWNIVATKTPAEIERWIEVRLRRQHVLTRDSPLVIDAILDESVLHRKVGTARVMAEQIDHLRTVSALPTVNLRILPLDGVHPILATSFALLEFAPFHEVTFPDIVHIESLTFSYLENEADTHMYRLAHRSMSEVCLPVAETQALLMALRDRWLARDEDDSPRADPGRNS
ncbi:helix-turn-helix domain-containing protein [Actinomadura flavalba]|uniref:helix-turn-helix domain-containing protein n=1 Tax=Actinomadura flavalba TaxID=1120938 RepID=UPI000364CD27|nr:helix-turn-helix transcriptional regulator [Actinomadura flavalba]